MGSCKLDLAVLTSLISHGRLAAPQHTVAASTEEGHLVIEPQLGREMADKMLQSGLSSHHQHSHSPVQVSRSVPCQLGQPWQPQHRKLTRAGLSSSQSGHKYRDSIWTRDQHGAKRRKQDLNRNVSYYNNKEWDK